MNFANGHIPFWISNMVWLNARMADDDDDSTNLECLFGWMLKKLPFIWCALIILLSGVLLFSSLGLSIFLYKTLNYFGTHFSYSCLWEVIQNPLLRRKKDFFPSSSQHMCHSFEFISGQEILEIRRKNVIIKFCLFRFLFNWGSHFFRFKRHNLFGGSFDDSVRLCRVWTAHDYISSTH